MQSLFSSQRTPTASTKSNPLQPLRRWMASLSQPAPYRIARWVFLRMLGVVYLCAFASLWIQLDGLIGSGGILPAKRLMELAGEQLQGQMQQFPTLLWLGASDAMLHGLSAAGTFLSVLLIAGIAPVPVLFWLWALYLSLSLGGQTFLSFQWDTLLLETGFLAMFAAPLTVWTSSERLARVSRAALWLLWWLLFRLMFESGFAKVASHDPTWRDLTALMFHYETQPLPTWIAWFLHKLPPDLQRLSTGAMFAVELLVPFLIFTTIRLRRVACGILVTLQVVIMLTGNYCFFNLLTIALCMLLLDDMAWPARLRRHVLGEPAAAATSQGWPAPFLIPLSLSLFLLSLVPTAGSLGIPVPWPSPLLAAQEWLQPFRTINNYGLFAVMTTKRPEIIIEGSLDGTQWRPYEFKYKPGDMGRAPAFVAPHQPRLDWQMWFAALGSVEQNPWFLHFVQRLLEGSPNVVALLANNPFPDEPPRVIRAVLFDYHFTDWNTRAAIGNWWRRTDPRVYCPPVTLNEAGQLILFQGVPELEPAARPPAQNTRQ